MVSSAAVILWLATSLAAPQHPTHPPHPGAEVPDQPQDPDQPQADARAPVDPALPRSSAQAAMVGGFRTGHTLNTAEMGLGHGGFAGPPRRLRSPDAWTSPGGALVQVASAGVKLTFPAGGELLFTPTGFFHLRDGSEHGPFERGLELVLGDGSAVRIDRSPGDRHPLGRVSTVYNERLQQLWDRGRVDRDTPRWREHRGQRLMALGDGTTLYAAAARGPVLILERVLTPTATSDHFPERQVLLHSDPLRESLARLPVRYASPSGSFPQVDVLARTLGGQAQRMLPPGHHPLPILGTGPLRLGLGGQFQLTVHGAGTGPLVLGLKGDPTAELPVLEWVINRRQKLELLRPGATDDPGRRYFERGMELMHPERWPLPARDNNQDNLWIAEIVDKVTVHTAAEAAARPPKD